MTHKQKEVVLDCAEATRKHIKYLESRLNLNSGSDSDVLLGMEITANKLEKLAEGS